MNIANKIEYVSTDDHRQVIPWIRIQDAKGNVTEYYDRNRPLTQSRLRPRSKRRMDCVDCHNRPAARLSAARYGPGPGVCRRQTRSFIAISQKTRPSSLEQSVCNGSMKRCKQSRQVSMSSTARTTASYTRKKVIDQRSDQRNATHLQDLFFPGDENKLGDSSEQHRPSLSRPVVFVVMTAST